MSLENDPITDCLIQSFHSIAKPHRLVNLSLLTTQLFLEASHYFFQHLVLSINMSTALLLFEDLAVEEGGIKMEMEIKEEEAEELLLVS